MNQRTMFFALLAAAVIILFFLVGMQKNPVACTTDAKICPDGTAVGRNPLKFCEFDSCPLPGAVQDYATLVNNIRFNGYPVEMKGEVSQPFIPVKGQAFRVGVDDFQAYEFNDVKDASSFISTVSADGSAINNNRIAWVGDPHFFITDKMVAIYIGHDTQVLSALKSVMGQQAAGADGVQVYCRPEQRNMSACTLDYIPVCGWFDPVRIQCIKYPCAQTFGNKCGACNDEKVLYYTNGECPK